MITKKQIKRIAEELLYAENERFIGKLDFNITNSRIERMNSNIGYIVNQHEHISFPCVIHDELLMFDDYVDIVYFHLNSKNIKYEVM